MKGSGVEGVLVLRVFEGEILRGVEAPSLRLVGKRLALWFGRNFGRSQWGGIGCQPTVVLELTIASLM